MVGNEVVVVVRSQWIFVRTFMKVRTNTNCNNCVKYLNFVRCNKLAPVKVKLKVFEACVTSTLLYNCEAFGKNVPKDLENYYFRLLKCALGVRANTPNNIVLIESGMLPVRALIYRRQLKFYRRYKSNLVNGTVRKEIFDKLLVENIGFINHYELLDQTYSNVDHITSHFQQNLRSDIQSCNSIDSHYKHYIYMKLNPDLKRSDFIYNLNSCDDVITRFRLGSHSLPIETGRWLRVKREDRLCKFCNVFGDEYHFIYDCSLIDRSDFPDLPPELCDLWNYSNIVEFFRKLRKTEFL